MPSASLNRASPAPAAGTLAALRAELSALFGDDARLRGFALKAALVLVPLTLAACFGLLGTGPDPRHNWLGQMRGYDFSQVWIAGRGALQGDPAVVYDLSRHLANQTAEFGAEAGRFAWHYPPVFLLPASLAGSMPYGVAFLAWMGVSLALFCGALALAAKRRDAVLIAAAHPLVFCNLSYGQNGLFTAGFLTLGALLVDRRPLVAGCLFGLVAYKPQLAALAPLLLLATGRWRCLAACAACILAQALGALALFGLSPWQGFLDTLALTNRIVLTEAWSGLDINAGAFGAARLLGASVAVSWAVQIAAALAATGLALRIWLSKAETGLRAAALLAAAPLISPYVPLYDLAPLVPASLLLALAAARDGGLTHPERALLIASPLCAAALRAVAAATGLSLGLPLAAATLALVAARALRRPAAVAP